MQAMLPERLDHAVLTAPPGPPPLACRPCFLSAWTVPSAPAWSRPSKRRWGASYT